MYAHSQWREALWQHLIMHSGEKLQCNHAFSLSHHLKTHLRILECSRTHSGEKTHKCSKCNFSSYQVGNLRIHLKTHRAEKSNKCNQCNFASSYVSVLRLHLKIHSGEKPNKCKQCDFDSSGASQLRKPKKCT